MNKIRIIDILNKIANGEKLPKKIRYQNYIYEYQHRRDTENSFNYMCNENGEYLSRRYFIDNILNNEVEILEEEKKLPEKLEIEIGMTNNFYIRNENGTKCYLTKHSKMIVETLNQVIDYLKSKGE